ncbi:Fpg/Nei family DNA glycosylase [Devriesea agamarum]|uniref:Fpg/Nei family DNA glycosylase n=1 Tax=Devriesea agamarum TaxID=472569 RepID=UPI00071C9A37|nr:zinc finger domain-containing protein [Devriesea agamarum]
MPEGHTIHRLADALRGAFGGDAVALTSPQGRFAAEADSLTGQVLIAAEAVGKHLFLGFGPAADDEPARYVHIHLGLYGSWTFAGDSTFSQVQAIGAPRKRVGERESTTGDARDAWQHLKPGPNVRLRMAGRHGLADLTGPNTCEVVDARGRHNILTRLGPDPLRVDADPARFVDAVLRSRTSIGVQLMNQQVIAGVGNIYRAETLFRVGLDPEIPGRELSRSVVTALWDDLVPLMRYGAHTGRIVTTEPDHRDIAPFLVERSRGSRQNGDEDAGVVPREKSFYVYHRQGFPCRVCGAIVLMREVAGRTLFWCGRCQKSRARRRAWPHDPSWMQG